MSETQNSISVATKRLRISVDDNLGQMFKLFCKTHGLDYRSATEAAIVKLMSETAYGLSNAMEARTKLFAKREAK